MEDCRELWSFATLEHIWSGLRSSARLLAEPADALDALVRQGVERAVIRQCRRRDPGLRWQRREIPRLRASEWV